MTAIKRRTKKSFIGIAADAYSLVRIVGNSGREVLGA